MARKHFVQKNVLSSVQKTGSNEKISFGLLHGFALEEETHIVSCSSVSNVNEDSSLSDVDDLLPSGIEICGIFIKTQDFKDASDLSSICQHEASDHMQMILDSPSILVLALSSGTESDGLSLYECDTDNWTTSPLSCSVTEDSVFDNCVLTRLTGCLSLFFKEPNEDKIEDDVGYEMEYLHEKVSSDTLAFHVQNSSVLVLAGVENNTKYKDILNQIETDEDTEYKKKSKNIQKTVVHIEMLSQATGAAASARSLSCAPVIQHNHDCFEHLMLQVPIDTVLYIHPEESCGNLHNMLTNAIHRQLSAIQTCLIYFKQGATLHTPVPYHFKPSLVGHLITVVYPLGLDEDCLSLESSRRDIHNILMLPSNCPQIRRQNVYYFPDEKVPGGYLMNPHVGLSSSTGGCQSLVQGRYTYHHYMQDHMDDNGWGCAYRSLQTLVSWFRFQGYTNIPVPTHREIQQALVDVKDKDAKFVGTKKWIGSTEVSYVMDHLYDITCKILFVNTGAELESKGRELSVHFETQGTPIMIGGGVLAHTILGVDFDEVTGKIRFLILDPHYTGGEDLKIIQDKGWCGWKGPDFWNKTAYYNLCMPQKPNAI